MFCLGFFFVVSLFLCRINGRFNKYATVAYTTTRVWWELLPPAAGRARIKDGHLQPHTTTTSQSSHGRFLKILEEYLALSLVKGKSLHVNI